jgi:hypothetical protein
MFYRLFKLTAMFLMVLAFNFVEGQHDHPESSLLSGVLIDHGTKKPVPYANIVIDGSHVGTSTSETGIFSLAINAERMECLRISSIGYSTVRLRIDSLQSIDPLVIFLKPSIIELDEVLVQASRFSANDFVKEAIQSLHKNTYPKDYLLEWYSTMVSTDSATNYYYSMETVFDDYNIRGEAKRTIRQQRETGISPKLVRNPKDTLCTLVPWFEIGLAEIENAEYGVFNLKNVDDFAFTYEGVLGLDDDSVYVIGYEAVNPRYAVTGWTNKDINYKGKLYITTKTYAVVRHTLEIAAKARRYEKRERHSIKEEVLYRKTNNYYFPYYIKSTRNLDVSRHFKPFHSNTYILRDVRLNNVEYKAGYNWCDNRAPCNREFWNSNYPR